MKNFAGVFKGRQQNPEVTLQHLLRIWINYGGSSLAPNRSQLLD